MARAERSRDSDILIICTGNVCRSPYIAARLAAALPELEIRSAGTAALVGEEPTEMIMELLSRKGLTSFDHAARQVRRRDLTGASLIITATGTHRARVAGMARRAAERTFTLRELARVRPEPGLGVAGLVAMAHEALSMPDSMDHDDDLLDPIGQADEVYESMAEIADDALRVLIPALGGKVPT